MNFKLILVPGVLFYSMGNCLGSTNAINSKQHLLREVKYSILNRNDSALKLALRNQVNLYQYQDFIFFLLRSTFFLTQQNYQRVLRIIKDSDEKINLGWDLKSLGQKLHFKVDYMDYRTIRDSHYVTINGNVSKLSLTRNELYHTGCDEGYYQHNVTYRDGKGLSVDAYIIYLRNIVRKYQGSQLVIANLDYLDTYIHTERKRLSLLPSNKPVTADGAKSNPKPSAPPLPAKSNVKNKDKNNNVSNICSICGFQSINTIYNCGHVTNCNECAKNVSKCPICRTKITTRQKAHIASF